MHFFPHVKPGSVRHQKYSLKQTKNRLMDVNSPLLWATAHSFHVEEMRATGHFRGAQWICYRKKGIHQMRPERFEDQVVRSISLLPKHLFDVFRCPQKWIDHKTSFKKYNWTVSVSAKSLQTSPVNTSADIKHSFPFLHTHTTLNMINIIKVAL